MLEYVTEAVALDKIDYSEMDSKVFLFTKNLGKIVAKVKSGRKITSKLSSHIEPLSFSTVRIVDKNSPQLIDALKKGSARYSKGIIDLFTLVKEISPEYQPDQEMWNFLQDISNRDIKKEDTAIALKILGFNPFYAKCANCLVGEPSFFLIKDLAFYCGECHP